MASRKGIPAESIVRDIKRHTRRIFTAEEKISLKPGNKGSMETLSGKPIFSK